MGDRLVRAVLIWILLLPCVYAAVPPASIYGFVIVNDAPVEDGTSIVATAECMPVTEVFTSYGQGYYSIEIPMDDLFSADDNGCTAGDNITFVITNEMLDQGETIVLNQYGSSTRHDFIYKVEGADVELVAHNSGGSSGSSGSGGPSGYYKSSPEHILPPPINIWGFIHINNATPPDGFQASIISNCFESDSVLTTVNTTFGRGYYDVNIPTDDPATENDEGCRTGDRLWFKSELEPAHNTSLTLGPAGESRKHDLYFITDEPIVELPGQITSRATDIPITKIEDGLSNTQVFMLLLVILAIITTILTIYDKLKNE